MKNIEVGDVVKFIPYYASSGMQGSKIKLQMPKHNCLGLVYKTYKVRGIGKAHVMLSNRKKKIVGFAGLETLCKL